MISAVFARICDLGIALGHSDLKSRPGCLELQVDEQWWIALNPHAEERECSRDVRVPWFTAYVEFNGWPAGFFGASGGVIAAVSAANEDALIEALEVRIRSLGVEVK
jgi:hypothetical protein